MSSTSSDSFRLAIAQMLVEPGAPDRNLRSAEDRIAQAARDGAHCVLLPEALDCGWTHPSARAWAGSIPGGRCCERLREAAATRGIHVCAGLVERDGERLYNAAVLVAPDGRILVHHRKIHELDFARALYDCGDRLSVADSPVGRIGVMICADAFVEGQVISRTLGRMGARLVLSPCAWAVPSDHDPVRQPYGQLWLDNYRPVAREAGMWIAGCSSVGPITAGEWCGRRCIGCSLVIDPHGAVAARGPYGVDAEHLFFVDLPIPRVGPLAG